MRLSRSFAVGANRNVRPLMAVSTAVFASGDAYTACLWTNVKLKMRSSSFARRRRKDGGVEAVPLSRSYCCELVYRTRRLCKTAYLYVLHGKVIVYVALHGVSRRGMCVR